MTVYSRDQLSFPGCRGRNVEAEFSGGDVTSDGGVLCSGRRIADWV